MGWKDYLWIDLKLRDSFDTLDRIEKMISKPIILPSRHVIAGGSKRDKGTAGEKNKRSGAEYSVEKSRNRKKKETHKKEQKIREAVGKSALNTENYTAKSLTAGDLNTIIGMYGNSVEDIYELNGGQEWMLERGRHVKSAFFLQIMTKAIMRMDPAAFRQQADKVCEKLESLRSSFVYRNVTKNYRVVLRDRHPEINYIDLSDLEPEEFDKRVEGCMEADRMRGFDLERDPLLRINVYKSGEEDTCALIISQPHINSDGTSLSVLFSELFIGYALDLNGIDKKIESQSYKAYAEHLQQVDVDKELDYWKQCLSDAPDDRLLPGQTESTLDYRTATHFVPFGEEVSENLAAVQKKLKVTGFTVLQCLWGIMAARLKGRTSMVFGAVSSGRDAEVSGSMMQAGGFVNILPVKITFQENERFSELAARVQKDFAVSMSNSHCSPIQIQKALGRKTPLFGHILNYHNFANHGKANHAADPVMPGGIKVIGGETYDNLSEDLCVYFTVRDGKPGCYYTYNDRAFAGEVIELFGEFFQSMLDFLKDITPDTKISALPVPDVKLISAANEAGQMTRMKIAGILKKHPVFLSVSDEELLELAEDCEREQFAGDYMIMGSRDAQEWLPVLVHGRVILYGECAKGWNNPVRVFRYGDILSMEALFGDGKQRELLITDEKGAVVIFIRADALRVFFEEHPESLFEIGRIIEKEKKNYRKLWLNAT